VTAKWIRPRPSTASQSSGRGRQAEELNAGLEEEEDAPSPTQSAQQAPEELQNVKVTRILIKSGTPSGAPDPSLGLALQFVCAMILPQVHLRKPCYDFSFL
jgi:hypothetical protein